MLLSRPHRPRVETLLLFDLDSAACEAKDQERRGSTEAGRFNSTFSCLVACASDLLDNVTNDQAVRGGAKAQVGIVGQVLDVEPLQVSRVFVDVDADALDKHYEVQRRFGGWFPGRVNGYVAKAREKQINCLHSMLCPFKSMYGTYDQLS